MKDLIRGVMAGVAAIATFYLVEGVVLLAVPRGLLLLVLVASLGAAVLVARFVWRKSSGVSVGLASSIGIGAVILGGIGFVGGFFGPMIFAPGANQGPLLGIFITGPLGGLLGAIAGAVYWLGWGRARG